MPRTGKLASCISRASPCFQKDIIHVSHAEGIHVFDKDGRRFMDFTTGIATANLGHCHPKVVEAVQNQAAKGIHLQQNLLRHEPMLELMDRLASHLPEGVDTFMFANSGAEVVEGAVKLARAHTKRNNIAVLSGGFHGRTGVAMEMTTSSVKYRPPFHTPAVGFVELPFPFAHRWKVSEEAAVETCIQEIEGMFLCKTHPESIAAIVVEPVLGEGGYIPLPPSYYAALREIARKHGMLFIADEVQSGFCRTGKWFGYDHYTGVPDPDVVLMAKGIASGMPLGAIATSQSIADSLTPGSHGSTYGGNVLACAAANATIQAMEDEGVAENARARGEEMMAGLRASPLMSEIQGDANGIVRGNGCMIGLELDSPEMAKKIHQAALERELLIFPPSSARGNVLRLMPPCNITQDQVKEGLGLFDDAVRSVLS